MSRETEEFIRVFEQLPEAKRAEVVAFARFLLAQLDYERWEQLLRDEEPRPRLEAFLRESAAEPETPLELHCTISGLCRSAICAA